MRYIHPLKVLALLAIGAFVWPLVAPAAEETPATIVTMTNDLDYEPTRITINAGDTVEWRNTSRLVHTVTADPEKPRDPSHVKLPRGARPFDSGIMRPNTTYRHTFTVPGEYTYFCIPHEKQGMIGHGTVRR